MAVLFEIHYPGVTAEQYDELQRRVGTRSGTPIDGLISHFGILTDSGLRVVDLWETQDALEAFLPAVLPATKELGFPEPSGPPRLSDVHNVYLAGQPG
jgi:hypothetical protein